MQKCKCIWCGDSFSGGPARIREHHVRDPSTVHNYHLCTSKANAAIEFQSKCKAALDEKAAKQAKKESQEKAKQQQQIAVAFVKETKMLAAAGVKRPKLTDLNQAKLIGG